jgi:hypothetical protein
MPLVFIISTGIGNGAVALALIVRLLTIGLGYTCRAFLSL